MVSEAIYTQESINFKVELFLGSNSKERGWVILGLQSECFEKVQVGKDQEKAQSEKDSHSKNRGGKKPN